MPILLQTLDEQVKYLIGSLHVQLVAQALELEKLRADLAQARRDLDAATKDA